MVLDAPHSASTKEVLAAYGVDAAKGLTDGDAAERLQKHGPNLLRHRRRASLIWILLGQFNSPIVFLLVAAAALALLLGERVEFVAIGAVLLLNGVIGFTTELRAVRSMEALRGLSTRSALVKRNGNVVALPAEELVPGDIAVLDAGDLVAADMRIISSANLAADESALTGESLPVGKGIDPVERDASLADRTSMLFKGCAITRGTGEAMVTGTGMNSELGRITRLVDEAEPERSPLERQLALLSRHLIWLTLSVTALVGAGGVASGQDVALMLKSAVALAVAAIPEGLPVVATLALARGMLRMAKYNALIEQLSSVETLGATTVILTDKTGTITENRMHVDRFVTSSGEIKFSRHNRQFLLDGRLFHPEASEDTHALIRTAVLCNNASLGDEHTASIGDPMEVALLELGKAAGMERVLLLEKMPEITEHAFDTTMRMMATVHVQNGKYLVAVKGAPEAVLERISSVQQGSCVRHFDKELREHWITACDALARQGLRLLAVAGKTVDQSNAAAYEDLTLYGVIGFQDPPRADIRAAVADARRAGITVIMVTGDHAATAQHISEAVGLSSPSDLTVEGRELGAISSLPEKDKASLREKRIFARVDPEQKLDLIELHQQAGEVVAMTGDGVNDAPALRKADIGIAMGLRGTQVAREAADLILRDDAFSTIIHAVREGRLIYTNIRRFTTYLLSCNLSEILVVGLAVFSGLPLPLLPLQILFLNLVTDVFPAFALGTVEADRDVLSRPPRPPIEPILARPQWIAIVTHGASIAAVTLTALGLALTVFDLQGSAVTTMCFHTLALAQLWHVFNMRNWRERFLTSMVTRNTYVWLAIALCIGILLVANLQPAIAAALQLVSLPSEVWLTAVILSFVPVVFREVSIAIIRFRRYRTVGKA
ncbi:cation-transporting P-type ATPase [Oricola cellulosilytica]|uniref:Cation-transporting P-type ATPase n=2 Tax=Oricola cellulosilytica TaxID=1429082 RepID=A0A4R0P8T8_9HYPH|nr:cation-transporting P-type ATPase [Oricola cellulosilytica]